MRPFEEIDTVLDFRFQLRYTYLSSLCLKGCLVKYNNFVI